MNKPQDGISRLSSLVREFSVKPAPASGSREIFSRREPEKEGCRIAQVVMGMVCGEKMAPIDGYGSLESRIESFRSVVSEIQKMGVPTIFVDWPGDRILPALREIAGNALLIRKAGMSAFSSPEFAAFMEKNKIGAFALYGYPAAVFSATVKSANESKPPIDVLICNQMLFEYAGRATENNAAPNFFLNNRVIRCSDKQELLEKIKALARSSAPTATAASAPKTPTAVPS